MWLTGSGLAVKIGGVVDFGGAQEFTTWDGEPVSRERPHGATIVVASRAPTGWRYLLLHRVPHGRPAREGDWAWTPPSGSRKPGEDLLACVARELQEEVGWEARPQPVLTGDVGWAVFALEVPWGTEVVVDGEEHDGFEWVDFAEARRRCRPAELEASFLIGSRTAGFG
jgi:8-oxo-dGTP pyrophosphatase MutT (NUDIX family)